MKLRFVVQNNGEPAAGIRSYCENVTIELEHGGWDRKDLEDHFKFALQDFFDGSIVYTYEEAERLWKQEQ